MERLSSVKMNYEYNVVHRQLRVEIERGNMERLSSVKMNYDYNVVHRQSRIKI